MSDAPLASMVLHGMEACLLVPFFLWVGAQLGLEQPLERAWAEAVAMQQPQWFAERALAVLMGSYLVLGFGCLALDILSPKFLQRLRAQAVQRRNWELFSLQPGSLGKLFAVLTLNIGVGSVVGLKSGSLARLVEPLIRPGLPSARECCLHFIALELVYEVRTRGSSTSGPARAARALPPVLCPSLSLGSGHVLLLAPALPSPHPLCAGAQGAS